jgi:hypothetical protein
MSKHCLRYSSFRKSGKTWGRSNGSAAVADQCGRSGILWLLGTDALTPAEKSKPVTPEEAKRVWASIPNPSARRVAKALT